MGALRFSKTMTAIGVSVALTACGSPPKPVFPDGGSRVPANDPQRLAEVKANNAQQRGLQLENDALRIQNSTLQKQMDDLRVAVTGVIASAIKPVPQAAPMQPQPQALPKGMNLPGMPAMPVMPVIPKPSPSSSLKDGTSQDTAKAVAYESASTNLEDVAQWRKYDITSMTKLFAAGQSKLPNETLEEKGMLEVAKSAQLITIHAATDSEFATQASSDDALARGRNALAMLVAAGIPRQRIKVEISASGAFAAPNDTAEGRALNRRVDILFYGKQPTDMSKWARL
jgi:flagellar motor protein MotB